MGSAQAAPLKGRLVTLEAEVAGLEGRINTMKAEVGATAGGGAEVAPTLLEKEKKEHNSALFGDYLALLRSGSDLASLTATISDLEGKMATVKSDIQFLENQVKGNAFAFAAQSLLETKNDKTSSGLKGSSLESRTVALEDEVANARTRVTAIEQAVVG